MATPHPYIVNMIADYYIKNKSTMRNCGRYFGLGKSTIHNYLHIHLRKIDPEKYKKVSAISQLNFSQKHLRGGNATRKKFKLISDYVC